MTKIIVPPVFIVFSEKKTTSKHFEETSSADSQLSLQQVADYLKKCGLQIVSAHPNEPGHEQGKQAAEGLPERGKCLDKNKALTSTCIKEKGYVSK